MLDFPPNRGRSKAAPYRFLSGCTSSGAMISYRTIMLIPLFLLLPLQSQARAAAVLQKITSTGEQARLQIFLRFSVLPEHSLETTGRRVDLFLEDTVQAADFVPLAGDARMIKMITRKKGTDLILSFYFRYPPQNVTVDVNRETASLMLDILTGNPFSAMYPDLSTRLKGVTLLQRNEVDYTNPLQLSPFTGRWRALFKEYETPVIIRPAVRLSLPPFPLAAHLDPGAPAGKWLNPDLLKLAEKNKWKLLVREVRRQLETERDDDRRNRLLLTYGEVLVRAGEYEEPYQLLQQIRLTYPDTRLARFARLLFIYLQAEKEDAFLAFTELDSLVRDMGEDNPFAAYTTILQAELAIQTERYKEAGTLLRRDDIAYTGRAEFLRLLRQADSAYGQGRMIRALVAYMQLDRRSDIISSHPRSLANFSDTLYTHQRYGDAADRYQRLSDLLADRPGRDLVLFRLAMSRLKNGTPQRPVITLLLQIQNAYPGTEGAFRATMKQTDLQYLAGNLASREAIREYDQIAEKANRIELREEASVKEAVVYALAGDNQHAVTLAMQILRDFQSGRLRVTTQALIIERLPLVLKQLIRDGQYVRALVLAKQNRGYFIRGWLKTDLLYDLARAYTRLGVYDRAVRTYQYIFDVSDGARREKVYLPLLAALFEDGRYELVEDYADRFFFRYPRSPDLPRVFLYRIRALRRSGHLDMAARLLDRKDRPASDEIDLAAASIYADLGRWQDVIRILSRPGMAAVTAGGRHGYELAEAYFQTGRYDLARPIYERLQQEDDFRDLAMFRLARIDLEQGRKRQALNEFRQLAEKGKDPLWIKLAKEEIRILELEPEVRK